MNYSQEIYDAVRSRISGGDIGATVERVAREMFDCSFARESIRDELLRAAYAMQRPFILLRPSIYPDGNKWCALYGDDLQSGVAGFGDTPEQAAINFDLAWLNERPAQPHTSGEQG